MKKPHTFLACALSIVLTANPALASSWAAYTNGAASIVARTVDWYHTDNAVALGCGRGVKVKADEGPDGVEYTSKYASIQIASFGRLVGEALNEKGLQGSILYLDDSRLPPAKDGRKDIDPYQFIAYAVSNFATVQEVVDSLSTLNFSPKANALKDANGNQIATKPENWPYHYALADAAGDRVIIEFVDGVMQMYHGKNEDAMSNEPPYDVHKTLELFQYQAGGTISTIDRRARAKQYLKDMYERKVVENDRALMAMRGLLASVFAGTEEINRAENEVCPTQWWALADQNARRYYLTRIESWCAEIYDFSMFDPAKAEVVALKAAASPYPSLKVRGAGK